MSLNRFRTLSIAIISFLILFMFSYYAVKPSSNDVVITNWEVAEDPSNLFGSYDSNEIPGVFFHRLIQPTYVVLKTNISSYDRHLNYLYFPQLSNSYLEVYADDSLIGGFGDKISKTGHIWYQPLFFNLPEGTKEITLKIYGVYEIGISLQPFFTNSLVKYSMLSILTRIFLPLFVGMGLMSGIILLFISTTKGLSFERKMYYRTFFLSLVFALFFLFDMLPFETMGNPTFFMNFQKLVAISPFIGFSLMLASFWFLNKPIKLDFLVVISNFLISIILLLAPTHYDLANLRNYSFYPILINAFYLLYKTFHNYPSFLFGAYAFFMFTVIYDFFPAFGIIQLKFLAAFGVVAFFSGFAYNLILEYEEIHQKVRIAHKRSITDKLTGAYNRGILEELSVSERDTFVYIDIDDFKRINDKYGHVTGDEVLKKLVTIIKSHIRSNDIVVRMGGDEFLVILKNCGEEKAYELINKIADDFSNINELSPKLSFGIKGASNDIYNSISQVDEIMYRMKDHKKENFTDLLF